MLPRTTWTTPSRPRSMALRWLLVLLLLAGWLSVPAHLSSAGQDPVLRRSTTVGGPIAADTTWTKAGSPYIVTQSIRVESGATLTIEPGVEVRFDGNYALEIEGSLIARGTAAERILFTSNQSTPAPGDWGIRTSTHLDGIGFTDLATDAVVDANGDYVSGSIIQYAVIEYGTGISINAAAPYIDRNFIRYSGDNGGAAVFFNGGGLIDPPYPTPRITANWIHDNLNEGFNLQQGAAIFEENVVTWNNGAYLAEIEGRIQGNTMACNSDAWGQAFLIVARAVGPIAATVRDNNLINNGAMDVVLESDLGVDVDFSNNYWGTTNAAKIADRVYDENDDIDIRGSIIYQPFLTSPVPALYYDPTCPIDDMVISVKSGDWTDPATWNVDRVPEPGDAVMVQMDHTVTVPAAVHVDSLRNHGVLQGTLNQPLRLYVTGAISNTGQIQGRQGGRESGDTCGNSGSNVELRGSPIYNAGTIQAGDGGDGDLCGGPGGSTYVFGRNTTNVGTICAGAGGDALDTAPTAQAGDGGETHIWGKWGGAGFLVNRGLACAGAGGDSYATGSTARPGGGGDGGRLKLISWPDVILDGGRHFAGEGGSGVNNGVEGRDGAVIIEPNTISLAGSGTQIKGGDVTIFGGDDWLLDLTDLSAGAISASGNISLAVGTGGAVDLGGNVEQVLQAAGDVLIASDVITLDAGVVLSDVISSARLETRPAKILDDVSLSGPGVLSGKPGATMPISLTLLNGGPISGTYAVTRTELVDWTVGDLPHVVSVPGLDNEDMVLEVTLPTELKAKENDVLTVTVTSESNPNVTVVERIKILLEAADPSPVYLPLVMRPF